MSREPSGSWRLPAVPPVIMKQRQRPAGGNRGSRVARQLHQEVAAIVRGELKDPRIGLVTITDVDLTADYAYLTVHFSTLPDDDDSVARSLAGLQAAAGFVRGQLGRRVRIHTTPEVRFVHDKSTAHGMAMSQLIEGALANQALDDDSSEPDPHHHRPPEH